MTRNKEERKLKRMGRRRLLSHVGKFGFAAASVSAMTQTEIAEAMTGDDVKYVYAYENQDGERTPVYKTMDRKRWTRLRAVEILRDRVKQKFESQFGSEGMSYNWQVDDESEYGLSVVIAVETEVTPDGEVVHEANVDREFVRRQVPETGDVTLGEGPNAPTVEDIPIKVWDDTLKKLGDCDDTTCQDKDENYANVPGGVPMGDLGTGGAGSMCSRFEHPTHGAGWVGAGHVSDATTGGDAVYTGRGSTSSGLGTVDVAVDNGWDEDYAFYDDEYSLDPVAKIADASQTGSYQWDVTGVMTKTGVQNDADDSTFYITQGAKTCRDSDTIIGTSSNGIKVDNETGKGDSGGIIANDINTSEAYIAGNITIGGDWCGFGCSDPDGDGCPDDTGGVLADSLEAFMNGSWWTL